MSTKKQISSLCKSYSVYEEIPEEFVDKTDVDSYLYHNILDISQSHHRIVRVSRGSNKKSFAFKVFHFCDSTLQQRFILKEEVSISKKEIESLLDSLGELLKVFEQANKVSEIPLPKPEFEIAFTKAKDELFSHCYKDIAENLNRQIQMSIQFERNKTRFFRQKVWTLRSIHSYTSCQPGLPRNQTALQESIFCCQQVWHFWVQFRYVAHSPLLEGKTIALLFSLVTFIVQIRSVRVKFACTIGLLNLSVCQVRNIPFEDQTNSFILSLGQGVFLFEENAKSVQDVIGDVYCPGKYCLNREKCESIGGYVTTPRSSYGCGNCGAWLFFRKIPFALQEHVKTTKTDKTPFFCWKRCYPTNNYYLMSHFNQPNIERKNYVWTTKYERVSEMCFVRHVEMKSVFTFRPIKRLVSTTVKSAKPAATFWIFLLRTKNRQLCCSAVTVPIGLQERRVATREKKNHLQFWRNISANHNQANPNPHQKRLEESKHGINVSVSYWLMIWAIYYFFKSFYSTSIYRQPVNLQSTHRKLWSSQSPTTESSGLSILVQTLLLLQ